MKIQWLGHSAFRLIESTGTVIAIDPFEPAAVGYSMAYCAADAVTVSQDTPEHKYLKGVKGQFEVIDTQGVFEVRGVHIRSVKTVTGGGRENLIFNYRLDGVEVCHLGNISGDYDESLIELLMPVDVLLIPVGGNGTLDAQAAKKFIDRLMPSVVIPMYYKSKNTDIDIDKVDSFLKLFNDDEVTHPAVDTIEFERDDFDNFQTFVTVPKRHRG